MYTINTTTTVTVTNDAEGIKVKFLGNTFEGGGGVIKQKNICKQVFERTYDQWRYLSSS